MSNASEFVIENGVLKKYVGPGGDVVIPEGITEIGFHAFYHCRSLKSVTIPKSVSKIESSAFEGCEMLEYVAIPDGVAELADNAFCKCPTLADESGFVIVKNVLYGYYGDEYKVLIPNGVSVIGWGAFLGCKSIESVVIPDSVTKIGWSAFSWCESLRSITIPESVTEIGNSAFYMCRVLETADIQGGVTEIAEETFSCTMLKTIVLPKSVKKIGREALPFDPERRNLCVHTTRLSALPAKHRIDAVIAFVKKLDSFTQECQQAYFKYIGKNCASLIDEAIAMPELFVLMCREKLISAECASAYMEAAQKSKNTELIALMLEYVANRLTSEEKTLNEQKREEVQKRSFELDIVWQDGNVAGLTFAATRDLETYKKRGDLKALLESKGAAYASSVSKKVDVLIFSESSSDTEKIVKAKNLGIELISERTFNEMIGRAFEIEENDYVDGRIMITKD